MSSRSAAILSILLLAIIVLSRIIAIWDGRDPGYDQAMLMSNFPLPSFSAYFQPLPYFEQSTPLGSVIELDIATHIFGNEGLSRFTAVRIVAAILAIWGYFIIWRIMRRYLDLPEALWSLALLASTNEVLLFTTNPKHYVFGFFFACALLWIGLSYLDSPTVRRAIAFVGCAFLTCVFEFASPLILTAVGGGMLVETISRHLNSNAGTPELWRSMSRLLILGILVLTVSVGFHLWYTQPMAEIQQIAYANRYEQSILNIWAPFSEPTIKAAQAILNVYYLMIEPAYFPQLLYAAGLISLLQEIHILCALIALVGLPTYWRKAPILAGGLVVGSLAFLTLNTMGLLPIIFVRHFMFFTPFAVPCFAIGIIVILRAALNVVRLGAQTSLIVSLMSLGLVTVALIRSADLKNAEVSVHLETVEHHPAKLWVYYGAQPSLRALRPDLMSGENFEVIGLLNHDSSAQSWQMQARDDDNFLTSDDYVERAGKWLSGNDPIWLLFAHYWPENLVPDGISRFIELAKADGRVCDEQIDKGGILVFCAQPDAFPEYLTSAPSGLPKGGDLQ